LYLIFNHPALEFKEVKVEDWTDGSWAWWHLPVISALGMLRQVDLKLKASLGYLVSSRPA
jgi:hypothetical protein